MKKKAISCRRIVLLLCAAILFCTGVPAAAVDEKEKNASVSDMLPLTSDKVAPVQTERIDEAGRKLGERIEAATQQAARLFGEWVAIAGPGGISAVKLVSCFMILLVVMVFERFVRSRLRERSKRPPAEGEHIHWARILQETLAGPFTLFVYTYGVYAAASPLFAHFESPEGTNPVHTVSRRIADLGGIAAIIWFFLRLVRVTDRQVKAWSPDSAGIGELLVKHCRGPFRLFVFLIAARIVLPFLEGVPHVHYLLTHSLPLLLITAVAWLIIRTANVLEDLILGRYNIGISNNLTARKIHTQIRFLKRSFVILTMLIAFASMLMTFDKVRQLGTSILASAGILGIVVGLAAQRSISNLLVGLQIAVTQPIRIDDVVIVEGEWGRIEEIKSTYAVVRIWDLRRLIVPLTYFTEKPFQNWTVHSPEILGTVFIYTDYSVPVEAIREKLHAILKESTRWDGRVWGLQVTSATDRAMELRALMSASDASMAWDLRCEVREELITFIQQHYPGSLPRIRAQLEPSAGHNGLIPQEDQSTTHEDRDAGQGLPKGHGMG